MQLLSAWKESLLLFKPSNFKLFFLVTLKSCIDTLKVWFRYWWWLIGLLAVGSYIISNVLNYLMPASGTWVLSYSLFSVLNSIGLGQQISDFIYNYNVSEFPLVYYVVSSIVMCWFSLLYVSLYASVRPSVAIKNWRYFLGYGRHLVYVIFWFLLLQRMQGIFWMIIKSTLIIPEKLLGGNTPIFLLFIFMAWALVWSIALLYLIFLLDSDASLKSAGLSIWRAAKMVFYNVPFFVITILCIVLIYYAVEGLFLLGTLGFDALCKAALFEQPVLRWVILGLLNSIDIFFMLILACFFVNYYIKKTHENYSLYFGK